jgi:site-specific DNA-methyltransferase (cytosine-N4-specific)
MIFIINERANVGYNNRMPSIIDKLSQVNWDFPDSNTTENINSIHPYPAKFIQEIPKTLIQIIGVPKGTWGLDPFCGSGATLVEAQLAGIPSIGVDLNPIACLISRVKTQPLPDGFLECAKDTVEQAKKSKRVTIPKIPNLDHWFRRDIQEATARLLTHIELVENTGIKDALRLSLSSILVLVSNQDSDTRYAAVEKNIDDRKFYALFLSSAERLWAVKAAYEPRTCEAEVVCKDILQVTRADIPHPIGLVVTSPPYPNAYEYWLYHKYRMFWLGYDPIQVKRQEIGARAHYFKKNHPTEQDFRYQMKKVLELFWATVVKDGHVCIVIGRSKIHGKIVDNAFILVEVAQEIGFTPLANITRQIAASRKTFNLSHANIKAENLLVFKK